VLATHALAGRLRAGGSVISISSIGAERGGGSYGAAKAGLAAWSADLSAELGPRGVTANVISPGYIAGTGFFLASPGARHITGQTIHVNGGAFTTR
jgi:3-oxoacyl-[acyl-carrier protein] reductase